MNHQANEPENNKNENLDKKETQPVESSNKQKTDIYEKITNIIIEKLEEGKIPWRKPWKGGEFAHCSLITKVPYKGINQLILSILGAPYESRYWLTFKQCRELGGNVKKGEKAAPITFYKTMWVEEKNPAIIQMVEELSEKDGDIIHTEYNKYRINPKTKKVEKFIYILKYSSVFNVEQCEGIDPQKIPASIEENFENDPIEICEQIVENMPNCPTIQHEETRAYYRESLDYINMPKMERFFSSERYYSILFHEMVHSTGHKSRLGRTMDKTAAFGDKEYSKEELTAELGAAFICSFAGISAPVIDDQAAYIQGWLASLKNDKKFIFSTSAQAQKAVDYILDAEK